MIKLWIKSGSGNNVCLFIVGLCAQCCKSDKADAGRAVFQQSLFCQAFDQ